MSYSDPVGDMLTRVRNSLKVGHLTVVCPRSRLIAAVLDVLRDEGYIRGYEVGTDGRSIIVSLKYYAGRPVIESLKRVSRPGLRRYAGAAELKPVHNGLGIAVLSTSSGVVTDREARKRGIGGEILCQVF